MHVRLLMHIKHSIQIDAHKRKVPLKNQLGFWRMLS